MYSPGKASNAGGVATSGLEMTQNNLRTFWEREDVDEKLKLIMTRIHEQCVRVKILFNLYSTVNLAKKTPIILIT